MSALLLDSAMCCHSIVVVREGKIVGRLLLQGGENCYTMEVVPMGGKIPE
jgi:hypothetical protein